MMDRRTFMTALVGIPLMPNPLSAFVPEQPNQWPPPICTRTIWKWSNTYPGHPNPKGWFIVLMGELRKDDLFRSDDEPLIVYKAAADPYFDQILDNQCRRYGLIAHEAATK